VIAADVGILQTSNPRSTLTPKADWYKFASRNRVARRVGPWQDGDSASTCDPAHLQRSDMMKRDIDLARQLLLDIEARGADCSVSVLRTAADHQSEDRVRYHLRLLIDAGYLKEIDRTTNGVPCLRLTDAGHELIELTRSESRWRHAKRACHEHTGGVSLTVIRGLLVKWALAPQPRRWRRFRRPVTDSLIVDRPFDGYTAGAPIDVESYPYNSYANYPTNSNFSDAAYSVSELEDEDHVRYVRVTPPHRNGWRGRLNGFNGDYAAEAALEATLPEHLI